MTRRANVSILDVIYKLCKQHTLYLCLSLSLYPAEPLAGVTILRQDLRVPQSNIEIFPCTWF